MFWDSRNGALTGTLNHSFLSSLKSLAFSSSLLAAATEYTTTLWDRETLRLACTLYQGSRSLSFSSDGSLVSAISKDFSPHLGWDGDGLGHA
jgi:WD40 repeat protein